MDLHYANNMTRGYNYMWYLYRIALYKTYDKGDNYNFGGVWTCII